MKYQDVTNLSGFELVRAIFNQIKSESKQNIKVE